jgi:ABC-2 type transport system ATP-binding protein
MLRLSGVRKRFGAIVAVDGLSLEVPAGEVFGLLGPNGAGKSTTIGMAVGLLRPDEGTVELEGFGNPCNAGVRRQIGMAPQALALYDEMTADENLSFFGSLYGLAGPALRARVSELLGLVGLTDRAGDAVKGYSGGMKRRLNLAAALMHDPPLVLLDEPTAGVDPQSRSAIFEIVRSLRERGRTVVYTTHYMEEAQRLCDRVGIIDHGKLLALDTVDGLISRYGGDSVVVVQRDGEPEERIETGEPVAVVTRELAKAEATGLRIERPDLEGVFLRLTGRKLRD